MINLKITIDQLKNYLGTGLKMEILDYKSDYVNKRVDELIGFHQWDKKGVFWCVITIGGSKPNTDRAKPICYRLSDLDKFIPELGFVPIEELRQYAPLGRNFGFSIEKDSLGFIGYRTPESWLDPLLHIQFFEKLFQWHFWPFGDEYFEKGLVIDKLKKDE